MIKNKKEESSQTACNYSNKGSRCGRIKYTVVDVVVIL